MPTNDKSLRKLIGDEMTVNPIKDVKQLRYWVRYGRLTIVVFDTLLPPASFGKDSPMLSKIGWTIPSVVEWLNNNGAKNFGPVKRRKPSYPLYD